MLRQHTNLNPSRIWPLAACAWPNAAAGTAIATSTIHNILKAALSIVSTLPSCRKAAAARDRSSREIACYESLTASIQCGFEPYGWARRLNTDARTADIDPW